MPQAEDETSAAFTPKIPYLTIHEASGERTLLYRFYNLQGELLYVGITNSPHVRWAQHAHNAAWWPEVRVAHSEWYPLRSEAEAAERTAVYREEPLHNYSHNHRVDGRRRFRSMYIHPMAREAFGDSPFTYRELSEKLDIPLGTVRLYGRRLEVKGAFRRVGTAPSPVGHGHRPVTFVAVDVPPELASPVQAPLLDQTPRRPAA